MCGANGAGEDPLPSGERVLRVRAARGARTLHPVDDAPLADGTYDAFVVDADERPDGGTALELTITAGEHKGRVLAMSSPSSMGDPIDLLGMPATIVVTDGSPAVRIDR